MSAFVQEMGVSLLLDEVKNNSGKKRLELSDIFGYVIEFSSDQYGSRFIQQKLESCTEEDKDIIFQEVRGSALKLMSDVFGNYVVQKFFELGSHKQQHELAEEFMGHVLSLSLQMYGCRVIQKALEVRSCFLSRKTLYLLTSEYFNR